MNGAAAREDEAEAAEPLAEPLPEALPDIAAVGVAETTVLLEPPMVAVAKPELGAPPAPAAGAEVGKVTVRAELAPAGVDAISG